MVSDQCGRHGSSVRVVSSLLDHSSEHHPKVLDGLRVHRMTMVDRGMLLGQENAT